MRARDLATGRRTRQLEVLNIELGRKFHITSEGLHRKYERRDSVGDIVFGNPLTKG